MVCLLVGEGDFSFALALAAQQRDPAEELVASCPRGCVDEARANVDKLTAMGVRVLMDVDARRLHEHPWVLRCTQLSEIVFNFPHVGGKMKIHENRKLLRDFFLSAGRVLRPGSLVRVALCRGQGGTPAESHVRCPGNTWQVVEMAAPGGFILHQVLPFCAPAGYTPRGYRSLMAADKNPLGRTVHHVAKMLELGVGDLITSWAAQEEVSATDAVWRCRLERSHTCSPTKPPFSHILDIDISDPARLRDVLCLLQDICRHNLTFHAFSLLQDSVDTEGCHGYCRGLLVATLMCQTPLNSPTAEIPVGKNISSLNPMTSCSATFEENSCSLQTSACNLLSDCLRSLNFDDDRTAHPVFPCKISLHIELLSLASSSLSDWRLLLPQPGPKPLFPTASFTHDLSFWLGEGFDQGNFLTFILNKVGDLLRSMDLIDDYLDSKTGRRSQCFRLCYQSLWKALSQEAARDFHLALGVDVSQVLPVTVR
ncbi:ferredoxin-fold anticodon-binding domain-containing protein 1 isoform X2 [Rhipicephalus sanguineus]|uniref:ferredoxin-fold anticodon-binding domain-containing protein 1 isoform X2 n=1 Tax=Rhipicephalus sanguineus TaxID=34632 RepID=UPI001894ABA8|nr:ferredoxin-fold anticodon-binding domain-containing protein 1 isoform X2 [Rhipicephalus sanguineus]